MHPSLSRAHQATYDAIIEHPDAHNLKWRDVRSMLGAMAEVVEEPNGGTRVRCNGHTLLLHQEPEKDVSTPDQLKSLRNFLKGSAVSSGPAARPAGLDLLIVLDHREACVYRMEGGSPPDRIVPHDPEGSGRHLHYVQDDSNGQRRPEDKGFYEAIAKALHGAQAILLFGSGTGAASAMEQLAAHLAAHHKDLAARVVGSIAVDEHHSTEGQLLAKAREFYSNRRAQPAASRA